MKLHSQLVNVVLFWLKMCGFQQLLMTRGFSLWVLDILATGFTVILDIEYLPPLPNY